MPTITIELNDTQIGKVMKANGYKPEQLSIIVKRLLLEKLGEPVDSETTQAPHARLARKTKTPSDEPTECSTNGSSGTLVTSGDS